MPTMIEVLTALATHVNTNVTGVSKAYSQFPDNLEDADCPAVIFEPQSSEIAQDLAGSDQMWTPTIVAHILYPMVGDTFKEMNIVNALVEPLVDAFTTGQQQRNIQTVIPGLPSKVYRIMPISITYSTQLRYGTSMYAQAEVTLDCKWHRPPGA